jgi:hypothetical protein
MMEQKALWGWYPAGNAWVKLQVDAAGRLVIDPTAIFEEPPTNGEMGKAATSNWSYDHWKDPYAHQDTGGKCGINVETLLANRTLTPYTDKIHQLLTPSGADRDVTLDTAAAVAGDRFVIRNNAIYSVTLRLRIYQGATLLEYVYAGCVKSFIFDGANWCGIAIGTAESTNYGDNIAIGRLSRSTGQGLAFGAAAQGYGGGVAVGRTATGSGNGLAFGTGATASSDNIALGGNSNAGSYRFSIALGHRATIRRVAETCTQIESESSISYNVTQGRWARQTVNNTPIEIFLGRLTGSRFTINAESALAFRIKVVARDNVSGDVAMYTFEGLIKRDAANNTLMSVCNKTVVYEDDAAWDCDVTADDANEAIIITVTGDDTNPTKWAAVLDGVETIF